MDRSEFNGVEALKGKKIVIVGCGAQGLNQGLNLRDSGLDVSYALRDEAISRLASDWSSLVDCGEKCAAVILCSVRRSECDKAGKTVIFGSETV